MSKVETEKEARNLTAELWAMANDLRGKMDASEYRDYILGFVFYRYLSHRQDEYLIDCGLLIFNENETSENLQDINNAFARQVDADGIEDWREDLAQENGYAIDPDYTWTTIVNKVHEQQIRPEDYQNMFDQFKKNALLNMNSTKDFNDVFDNINLMDSSLGNTTSARAKALSNLVERIDSVDFHDDSGHDLLGDVYEYLIAQFAGASGKKAGEFYTPHEVSKLLARLVTYAAPDASAESKAVLEDENRTFSVYDPTMGSGSLLLTVQNELVTQAKKPSASRVHFYGQEVNRTTYNLARMNLMMHDVKYQYMDLHCADTLESDWPEGIDENGVDHPLFFDAVVANPPYSLKWDNSESKMKDPRFKDYGKLAPKSKADYAFVEHGIYHMKPSGRMAIVLPHGVLFRGAAEGTIRKAIIEKNYLDAVIGLPSNLFYSTGIPTIVLVFRKDRKNNDILFIDASQQFEKDKKQNRLRDEDIELIVNTYKDRKDVDKLAHVATLDEIKENDYNLNIPRYVDTFEEEEPIDLDEVNREIAEVDAEIAKLEKELETMIADLVPTDPNERA